MYPVRSRLVALGNNDIADQMITEQVDQIRVSQGGPTVGTVKQMMAAKKAKEAQEARERRDLTNVDNSLAYNDPAFKNAKAAYRQAVENLKSAQRDWSTKGSMLNECKTWEVRVSRGRTPADPNNYCAPDGRNQGCFCKVRKPGDHPQKVAARQALTKAEERERQAKQVLQVAARAAMDRLSAYYPYKGYLIKPKLTSDYQWFRFDVQSNRTSNVLTTAERILEAQAWVDREVAREQERDIKIYDQARSEAVGLSKNVAIKALQSQNEAFAQMVAKRKSTDTAEDEGAKKTRNLLLIGGLAAGGLLLMRGGG